MRRPRHRLQVSTFPFLAVLLCAMGSLILLLLVIDRRAKVVARAKALQALAKVSAEDEQAAEARRAEYERRRQALHALLAEEDEAVQSQVKTVRDKVQQTGAEKEASAAQFRDLQQRLEAERKRLGEEEAALASRQTAAAKRSEQSQASEAELKRMAGDLDKLERALADLKALRKREQQTYSLVPYKGKRGDNRRPLYLECTALGLIVHPERRRLEGPDSSPVNIRKEVERLIDRQRTLLVQANARVEDVPYLLMLVRPDGVPSYYRTLSALEGLQIDFGYEFIDPDWILDFPEDETAPAAQPWMTVGKGNNPPALASSRPPAPRSAPPGPPSAQLQGVAPLTGMPGSGATPPGLFAPSPNSPSDRQPGAFVQTGNPGGTQNAPAHGPVAYPGSPFAGPDGGGISPGHAGSSGPLAGPPAGRYQGVNFSGGNSAEGAGAPADASIGPMAFPNHHPDNRAPGSVPAGSGNYGPPGTGAPGYPGAAGSGLVSGSPANRIPTGSETNGPVVMTHSAVGQPSGPLQGGVSGSGVPGLGTGEAVNGPGGTATGPGIPAAAGGMRAEAPGVFQLQIPPIGQPSGPVQGFASGNGVPLDSRSGPFDAGSAAPGNGTPGPGPQAAVGPIGVASSPPQGAGNPPTAGTAASGAATGSAASPGGNANPASGNAGLAAPALIPGLAGTGGDPQTNATPGSRSASSGPGSSTSGNAGAGRPGSTTTASAPGRAGGSPTNGNEPANAETGAQANRSSAGSRFPLPPAPGEAGGEPGDGSGSTLNQLVPADLKKRAPRPAAVRPSWVFSNRDWVIPIECTADALVLPNRQRIEVAALPRGAGPGNPLLEAVTQMIARRQATVPPGELPYQPRIRFLVRPEGLRAYYLAYPALESLRVPMARENVEPDDEDRSKRLNR